MKIKTHKSSSKRFRLTGRGKIVQTDISHQHLRHRKSKRTLKNAGGFQSVAHVNTKKIKRLLPNL